MVPLRAARALTALALLALVAAAAPAGVATHGAKRLVWPAGVDERWVPVVNGYEVAPRPLACGVGEGDATRAVYAQDFERATHDLAFERFLPLHAGEATNLFHRSTLPGRGTDGGHSAPGRLYFGVEATGLMMHDYFRVAGAATLPPVRVPDGGAYLAWKDKYEVEAFLGYDHMWVEVEDARGDAWILCSLDALTRPDKSSNEKAIASCSPWREGVCPSRVRGDAGTGTGRDLSTLPVDDLDPTAPHWEARYAQVPPELAGETVRFRFTFDSADGRGNNFMGWMLDDVMVTTRVAAEPFAPAVGGR